MCRYRTALATLICMAICGCDSFKSRMLVRNETNSGWDATESYDGVPITLKVPTHLKLDVIEVQHLAISGDQIYLLPSRTATPITRVQHAFIKTDKTFFVDVKRPGAGTADSILELQNQYFTKIQNKVTDETFVHSAQLLNTLIPGLLPLGSRSDATDKENKNGGGESAIQKKVKERLSVVASQIFDLNAPDLEWQVSEFLHCHLNACHSCENRPITVCRDSTAAGTCGALKVVDKSKTPKLPAPQTRKEKAPEKAKPKCTTTTTTTKTTTVTVTDDSCPKAEEAKPAKDDEKKDDETKGEVTPPPAASPVIMDAGRPVGVHQFAGRGDFYKMVNPVFLQLDDME